MAFGNGRMKVAGAVVAGGLLGAGAALLFAPQSGRRTRRDLSHLGKKALNSSAAVGMDLRHSVDDLIDAVADRVQEGAERSFEMAAKAGSNIVNAVASSKNMLNEGIEKVRRAS
jgi:gas vesicle protein